MKLLKTIIIFLILNFGALGIGSWLMDNGPQTVWYINLNQAPWTPPGWVFGAAWTTIMICFSIYMAFLVLKNSSREVKVLFFIQWILNVSWNYIFFNKHMVGFGLVVIAVLTILVGLFLIRYKTELKTKSLLILPYFVWLCIATSLNGYIFFNN